MSKAASIIPRSLGVLAALCFVGAASLAIIYPPLTTLRRLLFQLNPDLPQHVQDVVRDIFGDEAWRMVVLPLLMRPAWLLPLSASVVLAGLAFSLRSRSDVSGQPRLRN